MKMVLGNAIVLCTATGVLVGAMTEYLVPCLLIGSATGVLLGSVIETMRSKRTGMEQRITTSNQSGREIMK
jgi:hypothetical protein